MAKINHTGILLTILIFTMTLFNSCNYDQIESRYSDFESAKKDGLFEKGWIPSDLVLQSMSDIYLQTNIDLNTCIFSFCLSKTDIEGLKSKIRPSKLKFINSHGLKIPASWTKPLDTLNQFVIDTNNRSDSIYIAIDEINNRIYCWTK